MCSVTSNYLQLHGLYVARQAPLSTGFFRQECWRGLPIPPSGDLPDAGVEPASPALQVDSLSLSHRFSSVQSISCVWLFATPWTAAHQASLSITSSRTCSNSCPLSWWCHPVISSSVIGEVHYFSVLTSNDVSESAHAKLLQLCSTLRDVMGYSPPGSSVHGKNMGVGCHALLQGSSQSWSLRSPASVGRFSTTSSTGEASYQPTIKYCLNYCHSLPSITHNIFTVIFFRA